MNWYEIIVMVVGAFGGVGGLLSVYNAKSNKDTIDISNMRSLIEEERAERQNLSREYHEYKDSVTRKVESVKEEFDALKQENQKMLRAIYQAYRCRFPEETKDCPVIQMFQNCQDCQRKDNNQCN